MVSYEDRISIATPEGIDLDLTLAGLGSRFMAALIDGLIQGAVFIALAVLAGFLSSGAEGIDAFDGGMGAGIALALILVAMFLIFFGYPIAFEVWASGRTPGKRWTGLRVVRVDGAPVSFLPSAVRNLLRLVDFLPTAYGIGIVALLANSRNQRLGDIAAGTIVVREGKTTRPMAPAAPSDQAAGTASASVTEPLPPDWQYWDVSAVSAEDLGTVRRFLERRPFLTPEARSRLANELAARLRTKVSGPAEDLHPEVFLAEVAAVKSARG